MHVEMRVNDWHQLFSSINPVSDEYGILPYLKIHMGLVDQAECASADSIFQIDLGYNLHYK